MIDWHAALYPGAVVPPATLLEKALAEELDRGAARLALGRKATPRVAALINAAAAHTAEVDDIFRDGIYHPGAPTIAAAHALAADRKGFLRAVVVGYEISTRIGAAMGRAHYRYWHNTGTIGCFGAAAAAAEALGLDTRGFSHALATAATFSAGLQQAFRMDSMSKPLHAGHAAEAGLTAALAAREGVTGSLDVMEGEAGYGRAMGDNPDWARALATLGSDFHITRMTFKNHACCGHTFAAIDGALALQKKMAVKASEIVFIAVGTPQGEDGSADLQHVEAVARDVGRAMDGYRVIVDKSTVPVGTAERVRGIIAKETSHPFSVVSNPEFLKQGDELFHGQDMSATNVDASKKCNICSHFTSLSSIHFISAEYRPQNRRLQVEETCLGRLAKIARPSRPGYRRAQRKQSHW